MVSKKYIIAIDPATKKSGICIYDSKKGEIDQLLSLRLWDVFELMFHYKDTALFLIENSNLVKGNWHGKTARGQVGKNKSISQNIVDYAIAMKVDYHELKPSGYSKYFKSDTEFKVASKYDKTSNKDTRAAYAMIHKNQYHRAIV